MTTTLIGNWNYPTKVKFGAGRLNELPAILAEHGIMRPLVVTDPGLAKLPVVDKTMGLLKSAGLTATLFSDVKGNPVGKNVDDGVRVYREGKHDGVVAFGGGSALDAGKAIALMSGQKRSLWDFEDVGDNWLRIEASGIAKTVAIPTTAGTGSEVGRASVITNEDEHRKNIIFHPLMMPSVALCDPEVTLSLPATLTAWTGIDALSHSLEAYCAPGWHPLADGIATEGIRLVFKALRTAVKYGNDVTARAEMLAASLMGATAFQKGLGAMHAMAHPIGARLDAHHGKINAVVMPYVLRFNLAHIDERLARLARVLDLKDATATGFIDAVLALRADVGIPNTIDALGVTDALIPELAEMAAVDPAGGGNPIPLTVENCTQLFKAALTGDLKSSLSA
jgi:alcohol dehydrogenase class IV